MRSEGQIQLAFRTERAKLLTRRWGSSVWLERLIVDGVVLNDPSNVVIQQVSLPFYLPFDASQSPLAFKQCRICGEWRLLSHYYKDAKRRGGYYRDCKSCHRARVAKWRHNNVQRHRDNVRRWSREHRDIRNEYSEKYVANHPERKRAHRIVQQAVRSGKLHRGPCAECGATSNIHGHHEDYSKPLGVIWLCRRCHLQRHNQLAATPQINLHPEAAA